MSQLTQLEIARAALREIAGGVPLAAGAARSALAFMETATRPGLSGTEVLLRAALLNIIDEATSRRVGSKPEIARMARQALKITDSSIAAKCDGNHASPACADAGCWQQDEWPR